MDTKTQETTALSSEQKNTLKAQRIISFDNFRGLRHLNPSIEAVHFFNPSAAVLKEHRRLRLEKRARDREIDRTAKAAALKRTLTWVNSQDAVTPFNFYPEPYLHRAKGSAFVRDRVYEAIRKSRTQIVRSLWDKSKDSEETLGMLAKFYDQEAVVQYHKRRIQAHSPFSSHAGIDGKASLGEFDLTRSPHTKCLLDSDGYKVALPTIGSRWQQALHASHLEVLLCAQAPKLLYGTFMRPRRAGIKQIIQHVEAHTKERSYYVMRLHTRTTRTEVSTPLSDAYDIRCSDIRSAPTYALQGDRVCEKKCEIHEPVEVVMNMGGELNPARHVMLQGNFSQVHHMQKDCPQAFMVMVGNELFLSLPKGMLNKEEIINSLNYALEIGTGTKEYTVARDTFRESSSRFDFTGLTFWQARGRLKYRPTERMVKDLKRIHSQTQDNPMLWDYYRRNFLYYFRKADLKNVEEKLNIWTSKTTH